MGAVNAYNEAMKRKALEPVSDSVFYEQAPEGDWMEHAPALAGCHTQEESFEDAERNVKEAIELYLKTLPMAEQF